jgi:hypothetical protein
VIDRIQSSQCRILGSSSLFDLVIYQDLVREKLACSFAFILDIRG